MKGLNVIQYCYEFENGVSVRWTPVNQSGKAHDLFNVVIEFPAIEAGSDIVRMQKHGPPTAHTSAHLLKWELRERKEK